MSRKRTLMTGVLVAAFAIACRPDAVLAVSVQECRGSDGVVKFQDSPCLPGESSRTRHLSGDPVDVVQAPEPVADASVDNEPEATSTASQTSTAPPTSTFLCQREDGTRYVSESGVGNQYAIPLGMLGYPPMSLAEAYGGPNGIGVSAPGVRDVPVVPSRRGDGAAGLQTWVEDPCTRVTGAPLCNFYAGQLGDAQRRLRFAFSDTTEQVRSEIREWQSRVASCRR